MRKRNLIISIILMFLVVIISCAYGNPYVLAVSFLLISIYLIYITLLKIIEWKWREKINRGDLCSYFDDSGKRRTGEIMEITEKKKISLKEGGIYESTYLITLKDFFTETWHHRWVNEIYPPI
jgi:hypothetical protein